MSKSKEELINAIRAFDECFSFCCQCACELEDGEDGYMTPHGTCNECVYDYNEEKE